MKKPFHCLVPNQKEIAFFKSILWNFSKKRDKVLKNVPSQICERQSLKKLKNYGLLKQNLSLQTF